MASNRYVNELNGSATTVKVPHATAGHTTQTYATAPQAQAPQAQAPVYYNTNTQAAPAAQPAPYTAPASSGGYDYATRNRPYGWYAGSDGRVDSGLRGSL